MKKKVRIKKGFFALLLLFIIIGLGMWYYIYNQSSKLNNKVEKKVKEPVVEKKKVENYQAKIFMVGDALIHWGVYNDAKQSDGSYDFFFRIWVFRIV